MSRRHVTAGSSVHTAACGSDNGLAPTDPAEVEEMLYDVSGSKWSLTAFFAYLAARKECDVLKLWEDIRGVIARTLLSVRGRLMHEYAAARADCLDDGFMCFEVLGFDVLVDASYKPVVLEVNQTPSFHSDSALDAYVKDQVRAGVSVCLCVWRVA